MTKRIVRILAFAGTGLVALVAGFAIVSQTAWFRDWVRTRIVEMANRQLQADLAIGALTGNLFTGVGLHALELSLDGRPVVSVDRARVAYDLLDLLGGGVSIDDVTLTAPVVHLRRSERGLNLANLVETRRTRGQGGLPIDLRRLEILDGQVTIGDRVVRSEAYETPARLVDVDAVLGVTVRSGRVALDIERLSFDAVDPALVVENVAGTIALGSGRVIFDDTSIVTRRSALEIDGSIRTGADRTVLDLRVTSPNLALQEFAELLPALEPYAYAPELHASLDGPLRDLAIDFDVRTSDGAATGEVRVDAMSPGRTIRGEVHVTHLNLAAFAPFTEATDVSADSRIDFDLDRRRLTFDARTRVFGGRTSAAGTVTFPQAGASEVSYDISGHASGLDPDRLPEPARPPFSDAASKVIADAGVAAFDFHVRGSGRRFELDLNLDALTFAGARLAEGTDIAVSRDAGGVRYHAQGEVADLDLRRLANALGLEAMTGLAYASDIDARFDLDVRPRSAEGLSVEGAATLAESSVFGVLFPRLEIVTDLRGGNGPIVLKGEFSDVDIGRLIGRPALSGEVAGTLDATLSVADLGTEMFDWREDLDGGGRVDIRRGSISGVAIADGAIAGGYADGVVDLRQMQLTGPDLEVSASGRLAITNEGVSSLTFSLDTPPLGGVEALDGRMRGEAAVAGRITGNRSEYRVTGTLSGSDLAYAGYGALSANAEYDLTVPALDVSRASIEGRVDLARVEAHGRPLGAVTARVNYAAQRLEFDATVRDDDRRLEAAGALRVHPDHNDVHLNRLALVAGGTEWHLPPGADTAIRSRDGRIVIDNLMLAGTGAARISADGALGDPSASLSVSARQVPIGAFDELFLEGRRASGTLDATAVLSGALERPTVRARFSLVNGSFDDVDFHSLGGEVTYASERTAAVDVRLDVAPGAWLTATGTVPLSSEGPAADALDLRVQSAPIDLGIATALTDEISSAAGTVRLDVHATGTYEDPLLNGWLAVSGGAFTIAALQSRYTGLDGRLVFTPDLVSVPAFSLRDDDGHVMQVAGELGYRERQVGNLAVTVAAEDFEIVDNGLAEIEVDTALRITGDVLRPKIEGRVEVASGTIQVDGVLDLIEPAYPTYGPPAAPNDDVGSGRALAPVIDVLLEIPGTLLLRGTDLHVPGADTPIGVGDVNITIGGELRARKDLRAPLRLVGELRPVRGTYEFQGRQFEIARTGSIAFAGLPELNPRLDVAALRTVSGVETQVHVGGTLRNPTLDLSSDPPLDDADILSLIVFNQPINQLGSGEQISLARRAAGLAAGFLTSRLTESIGGALEVDVFDIDIGGASLTPTLTIGEQFAEGLYLKLRQQLGEGTASTAALEYQLTDWMRVEGEVSRGESAAGTLLRRVEQSGISLLFRFNY